MKIGIETSPQNMTGKLCRQIELPPMVLIRQKFDPSHIPPDKIPEAVLRQLNQKKLKSRIMPGMTIAIPCGSRGLANIDVILRTIADFVKSQGAKPFIFPAMGSHGGATVEGQTAILTSYGVTEEKMGCPIRATMETVQIGETREGIPAFMDKYAYESDGVILCGRIKAHTAFRGNYESGLLKMAAIGMGKQHGAEQIHAQGFANIARVLEEVGKIILKNEKVIGGLGLIENAFDQTYRMIGLTSAEIIDQEPRLLAEAKEKMARFYFDSTDVLVVDKLGKDISGDGMDPNITGKFCFPEYASGGINAQRLIVLDLTDKTHGNFNGLGLADITTLRLINKLDVDSTFPNAVTSTALMAVRIPIFTTADKEAIQLGIRTCNHIDKKDPRIIHIRDTMHLEYIYISKALLEEAKNNPDLEVLGNLEDWPFNGDGNLW